MFLGNSVWKRTLNQRGVRFMTLTFQSAYSRDFSSVLSFLLIVFDATVNEREIFAKRDYLTTIHKNEDRNG